MIATESRNADPTPLFSRITRGKHRGAILYPHRYNDGYYVVSKSRYERDYVRVMRAELLAYIRRGFSLRMSNPAVGVRAPSLICNDSIVIGEPG